MTWLVIAYALVGLGAAVFVARALTEPFEKPPELGDAAIVTLTVACWPALLCVLVVGFFLTGMHLRRRDSYYGKGASG